MCGESVTCGGRGDVLRVCWRGRITCVHGEGVVCVCLGCAWQKCGGRVQRVWREGAACAEGGCSVRGGRLQRVWREGAACVEGGCSVCGGRVQRVWKEGGWRR